MWYMRVEATRHLEDWDPIADDRQHVLIPLLHDTQPHTHACESHASGEGTATYQAEPPNGNARPEGLEPNDRIVGLQA
jgi:hypothetical protein